MISMLHQGVHMKFILLFLLVFSQAASACDVGGLRKEILSQFVKDSPVTNEVGEKQATTVLKEMYLTDTMLRIRGEDFFMMRMVFEIAWNHGVKEEKEMLLAAIVDLASCKIESYETGDILGSTVSIKP